VLALLAGELVCACAASGANADARFGDSTWVAPNALLDSASTIDGPRVALPDHERGWETALRAPFRVVFYPLRLLGSGLEAGVGYIGPRYLGPKAKPLPKSGPTLSPLVSFGAVNDLSLGADLTWVDFPTADAKLRLAASWSTFDGRSVRFSETFGDRRPLGLRLGADYEHKPNRRYYGIGNNTPETDLSYFRLASTNVEAALLIGATSRRQVRLVGGYSGMSPGAGYHGTPLLDDVFTPASAPYAHQTTQELWYGLASDFSALDDARNPSLGVGGNVDLRRAVGLRSSDPDYYQWSGEVRAFVPVFARRRVIALRGVYAGVGPVGGTTTILPFYRLPESRGLSHFAAYSSGRYRDQQLMLARVEYRWQLVQELSILGLYELGEVAPRTGLFSLNDAHLSYGGGLRLGLSDAAILRFELATSDEGLHAFIGVGSNY
jgi:outer membrane protein assembly factor BamA